VGGEESELSWIEPGLRHPSTGALVRPQKSPLGRCSDGCHPVGSTRRKRPPVGFDSGVRTQHGEVRVSLSRDVPAKHASQPQLNLKPPPPCLSSSSPLSPPTTVTPRPVVPLGGAQLKPPSTVCASLYYSDSSPLYIAFMFPPDNLSALKPLNKSCTLRFSDLYTAS